MGIPSNLNPIADAKERQPNIWQALLQGTYLASLNPVPMAIQRAILAPAQARDVSDSVRRELHDAIRTPFSFQEFEHCRQHLSVGKSPGPSGLTTTQRYSYSFRLRESQLREVETKVSLFLDKRTRRFLKLENGFN